LKWIDATAELEIIHHGNYMNTDDKGQSVATCGARSMISPVDGIRLDLRTENVTCWRCLDRLGKMVDRAIARGAHGYKP
jgi:hypothetical protein